MKNNFIFEEKLLMASFGLLNEIGRESPRQKFRQINFAKNIEAEKKNIFLMSYGHPLLK